MQARHCAVAVTRYRGLSFDYVMMNGQRRPLSTAVILCTDFDQTLTTRDTISLLFEAANAKRTTLNERAVHAQQVQRLVGQYTEEYTQFMNNVVHGDMASQYEESGLRTFLKAFAAIDMQSIQRVITSKTLQGLEQCDVEAISDQINLMDKSMDVLAICTRAVVISANWSQTMLQAKLRQSNVTKCRVIANELEMDTCGVTTGGIHVLVQSPDDKALFMKKETQIDKTAIFVGDSTNDLLAMLEADIGIIIGFAAESTLGRVCRQFGIGFLSLSDFDNVEACKEHTQKARDAHQRVLFTAMSWDEIYRVLAVSRDETNHTTIN